MSIGSNIKKYRLKIGLTQKQLADKIDKSKSSIEKYESDKTEVPLNVLEEIAEALNTNVNSILYSSFNEWLDAQPIDLQISINFMDPKDYEILVDSFDKSIYEEEFNKSIDNIYFKGNINDMVKYIVNEKSVRADDRYYMYALLMSGEVEVSDDMEETFELLKSKLIYANVEEGEERRITLELNVKSEIILDNVYDFLSKKITMKDLMNSVPKDDRNYLYLLWSTGLLRRLTYLSPAPDLYNTFKLTFDVSIIETISIHNIKSMLTLKKLTEFDDGLITKQELFEQTVKEDKHILESLFKNDLINKLFKVSLFPKMLITFNAKRLTDYEIKEINRINNEK